MSNVSLPGPSLSVPRPMPTENAVVVLDEVSSEWSLFSRTSLEMQKPKTTGAFGELESASSRTELANWRTQIILNQTGIQMDLQGCEAVNPYADHSLYLLNMYKLVNFGSFASGKSPGPFPRIPLMQKN